LRRVNYDEDDFNDFLAKIEDVNKTIAGIADGSVDVKEIDAQEEKIKRVQAEKEEKRARAQAEAEANAKAKAEERAKMQAFKDANQDKLNELKEQYYLRKARREKWLEFREQNRSRAFSDYYKGWDLFEEDPDEELFCESDKPAAVEDQSAFDAMAKDIEERTNKRNGMKHACEKERERANLAFKAGQYSEAIAGYSRAVEHFKGDKACYANRAAAHIKVRNFLSALDDCSRTIEIAKFLDNDHEHRPPPPPLLKAYVRRAAAQSELGRYGEAADDLATALAMAPEMDRVEIKRQQKILKEDAAAARQEAFLDEADKKAECGAAAIAGEHAVAMRTQVRELLGEIETHSNASSTELNELLNAADLGEAQTSSKAASAARVRAANAAVRRAKSEAAASKALSKLCDLARDSSTCRVCVRHAGGVRLLLSIIAQACSRSIGLQATARIEGDSSSKVAEDISKLSQNEAITSELLWASSVCKLLCIVGLERRNQYEVHLCGGSTQILRELRRIIAGEASQAHSTGSTNRFYPAATFDAGSTFSAAVAALATQLRLLALCCAHEKVAHDVRRLASAEGTHERLLLLLRPESKTGTGDAPAEILIAATALLAALSSGDAKAKASLLPYAEPLCDALATHVASPFMRLAEQAATALGNLSTSAKFRKQMAAGSAVDALLHILTTVAEREGEEVLLPNTLAALHNCTLSDDAVTSITTETTAAAILPLLDRPNAPVLARRATALMAKCAARHTGVVDMLLEQQALPSLVQALVAAVANTDAAGDSGSPRIVEVSGSTERITEEDDIEAEEGLLGSVVRILAACGGRCEAASIICDSGALPVLAKLLEREDASLRGNAALCIAECAKDPRCLAVLAVQPLVPKLLDITHNGSGGPQKNAAIALGRLAKNPRCLQAIRDNHGIEILARAMKGKMSGF